METELIDCICHATIKPVICCENFNEYFVLCHGCRMATGRFDTREKAIDQWNETMANSWSLHPHDELYHKHFKTKHKEDKMERIIQCPCGGDTALLQRETNGSLLHHISCQACNDHTEEFKDHNEAIAQWNSHKKDELEECYVKKEAVDRWLEGKPHLCDTCQHQIRGTQNGCKISNHECGVVWDCKDYEEATKAKQIGGDHYSRHKIQVWDIVDEYQLGFYEGNILKYLLRRKGNRVEDLQKLIHYAEKAIQNMREVKFK